MTMPDDTRRLTLPKVEAFSSTLRTTFVNIGFFAALLLMIPAVASQFSGNAVVIDPIAVPKALAARGLTPDVAANRLWDGLQSFAETASIARATIIAVPDSQLVEFSLPDTGISIDSILLQLRQFFGQHETRIAGEIVCETADCAPAGQRLRLRVIRGTSEVVDLPPIGEKAEADYFHDAAAGIFDVLDPFVSIAARALTDPQSAATRARRLALSGHPDAKWAHNLLGDIARKAGDQPAAIADYQAALALDPTFSLARINLARALAAAGDFTAADQSIADVATRDPRADGLAEAQAEIALTRNDREQAIVHYRQAAALDPLDPDLLARLGELELELDRTAEAIGHLEEALDLDPGHADALRLLGTAYRDDGDLAAAERLFQDWADYVPDSIEAHLALAEIQVERGHLEDAATHYDRVVALAPDEVAYARARGEVLLALGRYAQAVDGLSPFADAEMPDPAAVLLLARVQQAFDRPERAMLRYRQFRALAPEAPERAEVDAILAELESGKLQ